MNPAHQVPAPQAPAENLSGLASPTVLLYLALAAGAFVLIGAAPDLLKMLRRR